jgi:hypothetical protein
VSRVQSTDFDVLVCLGGWTVRLTSRLDVQGVSVPSLTCVNRFEDECEVCERCWVYRGLLWRCCLTADLLHRALLLTGNTVELDVIQICFEKLEE